MRKGILPAFFVLAAYLCAAQNLTQLITDAEYNLKRNHWEQALKEFKSILDNHEDNLTYYQKATIYNHIGFLNLMFLEPNEAERSLNLSLLYHEEAGIPNERDFAHTLVNMGMLYLEQVEFDLARSHMQRALDILEKKQEYTVDYLIARAKLARIYEEAGSYTLALSIYNDSYDKLVAMGNELSPDFADICSHKGRILILTGDPREGEKFINLSSTIYESLGPEYNVQRAESMEDLAIFYERMGRWDEAERMLLQILKLKRSIPDEADILIIETLNDLGIMYHQLGKMRQAEEMFNEVVVECEENVGTDHPFYATAKNNLGSIAIGKGDFATARVMLQDALKTYKSQFGTVHPYYANTLNNLARVERKLGNLDTAERYYTEVLQIDDKIFGDDHPNYATTLLNIGVLYSASGREYQAEEFYAKALEIREKALGVNHPSYGSALEYMGMHYLATDNKAEAEKNFRKSIRIQINQMKALFPIMTENEREGFFRNVKDDIDRYNYIASQLLDQNPELVKNIFDFQSQTKTVLFNSLDKIKDKVEDSEDDLLRVKYQKWLSDKRLLASYYQMGVQELQELHVNLDLMEADLERQESILQSSIPEFEEALPHDKLNWKMVTESVESNEVLIEVVRIHEFEPLTSGNEKLFGFTDNTQYLAIIFLPGKSSPEFALLGNQMMTDEDHFTSYINSHQATDNSFYSSYWKPVVDKVGGIKNIRVVPDGVFYKINPNQIKINSGKYVIDEQYVSYLTSVHDLFRPKAEVFNNKTYLFGDAEFDKEGLLDQLDLRPLPGAEDEVNMVGEVLSNWKVNTYLGPDASELRLRSAYNPTVLHIASHGFFGDLKAFTRYKTMMSHPLFRSGLYLAGASDTYQMYDSGIPTIPENDGILTAYEAMNLDLSRTRLVVLSSLEANDDSKDSGEGFYGLLRAFMVAGARNVIASFDNVDPNGRNELFELFYKKFLETDKIEYSFRYAQLELRKKYDDPKVWGSFILIGSGS
ncbi:MAG: CHAT domain-containing protein [Ekhidna sp.]